MEYYIVRAMMIGMLQEEEVKKLQEKENKINRALLPNELRNCFQTKEVKEYYGIPDDDEDQVKHSNRIGDTIRIGGYLKTLSPGRVCMINLDALHEFDWAIYHKLDELDLYYKGNKKLSGRLKDMIKVTPFILSLALQRSLI